MCAILCYRVTLGGQVTFSWRPPTSGPIANSSVLLRASFDEWRPCPLVQQDNGDWTVTRMVLLIFSLRTGFASVPCVSSAPTSRLAPCMPQSGPVARATCCPACHPYTTPVIRCRPTSSCTCSRLTAWFALRRTKSSSPPSPAVTLLHRWVRAVCGMQGEGAGGSAVVGVSG